jgi:2-dehydropantoate 2-reductase
MKVGVVGTGGVGGYFGAKLAASNVVVQFLTTPRHVAAIGTNGLQIKSFKGDFTVHPPASDDPVCLRDCDVIFVTVKAWQVIDVANKLDRHISKDAVVIPLENGIGSADELAAVLGRKRVIPAVCKIVSFIEGPGIIKHIGVDPWIALGEFDGTSSQRATDIYDMLTKAGIKADLRNDIFTAIWEKFIFITAWSTVGALTRSPIGELRAFTPSRNLLISILNELHAIGRAKGVVLGNDTISKILDFIDSRAPDNTASMQRDIMEGRPSELEAQTGMALKLAESLGVAAPSLKFAYASLALQEGRARSKAGIP